MSSGATTTHNLLPLELLSACKEYLLYSTKGYLYLLHQDGTGTAPVVTHCPVPASSGKVINGALSIRQSEILVAAVTIGKHLFTFSSSLSGEASAKGQLQFKQLNKHVVPKRISNIVFCPEKKSVIMSDAFGDVYRLPIHAKDSKNSRSFSEDKNIKEASIDKEKSAPTLTSDLEESLILGHFSSITTLTFLKDGQSDHKPKLVTSDRDSRIRVSNYPHTNVIESFCLGHSDVVSATLALPSSKLLSGCADGSLRIWDTNSGDCLQIVNARSSIKEHMVDEEADVFTIAALVHHPTAPNSALFAVTGCRALFAVHGLCDESNTVKPEVKCVHTLKGPVCGLVSNRQAPGIEDDIAQSTTWVSSSDDGGKLFFLRTDPKVSAVEDPFGPLNVVPNETIHYRVNCSDDHETDGQQHDEGEENIGRFEWLSRQRKREMVVDWKGKKRRYPETET